MPDRSPPGFPVYASTSIGLVIAMLHYGMSLTAEQLADAFADADAALPLLTQALLPGSAYYWLLPVTIVAVLIAHHTNRLSRRVTTCACAGITIASMLLYVVGLYLPVVRLGTLVASG